jgi:phosphonate transport system ATP-binding protein
MSHALSVSYSSNGSSNGIASTAAGAIRLVDGVSKRYDDLEALAPLSLSIAAGESVALFGPSGSGKTTLLRLMSGQLEPSTGRLLLEGHDLSQMRPGRELSAMVGMIHQQFDLVPNLSALQNVLAGRLGRWNLAKSLVSLAWPVDKRLGLAALERVGVMERAYVRASRLSGGEQQRVAIARLLVQDPAVVLADEPVASLDPARAEEVLRLLIGVAEERGKTLVASMHSVELARAYFSRLVGLRNGVVQFDLPSYLVTDGHLADLYNLAGLRRESQVN